jgi:hypothetical protein
MSMQMAVRFAFASCRLGPAVADGAWFPFASTPTAAFLIKFLKAASERPVFDTAQLSVIDAASQARIFDLVFDASDPRFVITSADVTSASAAVLAKVDLTAAPMAFARADEMCGADRRMYAFATSLLLSPASGDRIALAADDAGAALIVQAAASTAHMVSGLYAGAAPGRSSDSTAVYRFIAASSAAKFCLALAHSTAGVVANVHTVETFARDRPAAIEENMDSVIQWFPRLHAVLGVSPSPVMPRLYALVAGMPASTKSPLTTEGLHALDFQVSRLADQADFKTVCRSLHETAESAAALKAGTVLLRPLLDDEAYKLLACAGKDVDAKTLVAMALGSGLVICRLVVLDGLNLALAKQTNQLQVLVELAAKRGAVADAVRLLMNEDSRIKRSVVPLDVPPCYVSAALRGVLTSTLSDYADLASKFSPKLYAENPYSFAGSNFDILSSPARGSAALAMFAATVGPLADGFGYDGFDTFVAAVIRATADLAGRRRLTKYVVDLFESGMRDAMEGGRASMRDVRLDAKFVSKFDGPAFTEAAARLVSAHANYDSMEQFLETVDYVAPGPPPSYLPPDAQTLSLAAPFEAQPSSAAPFHTAARSAAGPSSGPSSAVWPAAAPALSTPALLHSPGAPAPSSGSRAVRPQTRVAAQAAAAQKRLSVAAKLPDGSPFFERMMIKGESTVRVGIFGYPAAIYEARSQGCAAPFVIRLATGVQLLPERLAAFRQGLCTVAGEAHAHSGGSAHRCPPEKLIDLASARFEVPDGGWPELPGVPKTPYFGGPRRGP